MKIQKVVINGLFIALLSVVAINTYSQKRADGRQGRPAGECRMIERIPDLTDTQKEQIEKIRTIHLKNMNEIRKDLKVKHVELENLMTSDDAEIKDIYKKVEEIGDSKVNLNKETAAMHFEIRNILTEEQKIYFDSGQMRRPHHRPGFGQGDGFGPEHAKCWR